MVRNTIHFLFRCNACCKWLHRPTHQDALQKVSHNKCKSPSQTNFCMEWQD